MSLASWLGINGYHTVLGSRGLLIVTSVAIGRMTMAAGARCMNVGLENRVREVNSVRTRDIPFVDVMRSLRCARQSNATSYARDQLFAASLCGLAVLIL
jgi:hypothetical protein